MSLVGTVDSVIRVPVGQQLDAERIEMLRRGLSYPNPRYASAIRRGAFTRESSSLSTLRVVAGEVVLPRGATALVRSQGIRLLDRRLELPPVAFALSRDLRDYQAAACAEALRREQGLIVLPTGGGKTLSGLAIVAAARQPALILVPSLDLAEQWAEGVRRDLGIAPSLCTGGAVEVGAVTIAHPRTLAGEGRLASVRGRFGLVLVDEAHHAPSATTAVILDALPARYRFGVTATLRGDELAPLVAHYLGSVIFQASESELADRGFLARPRREEVRTGFTFDYSGPDDWHRLLDALVADGPRNALLVERIARECRGSVVGLALTGRVAHVEATVDALRARGVRAAGVVGSMPPARRSEVLEDARKGALDVLCATSLADEGLDVPNLSRLFLTFPARSEGRLTQRLGRILRPHPGKGEPVVFDFVDSSVGVLRHQAMKRAAVFEKHWRSAPSEVAA